MESTNVHGTCDFSLTPDAYSVIEVGLVEANSEPEENPHFDVQDQPELTGEQQGKLVALLHK